MRTLVLASSIAAALAFVACGGDDDGNQPTDAAGSGSGSGSSINDPIVGMWNRAPEADATHAFDSVKFGADGTVVKKMAGTADSSGTFTLPSAGHVDILTAGGGSGSNIDTQYVATADHLMLTAFFPKGTVAGYVGTWENLTVSDGTLVTTDLVLKADMTGTLTAASSSGSFPFSGTYTVDATGFTFMASGQVFHFTGINNNQAISYLYFVKA